MASGGGTADNIENENKIFLQNEWIIPAMPKEYYLNPITFTMNPYENGFLILTLIPNLYGKFKTIINVNIQFSVNHCNDNDINNNDDEENNKQKQLLQKYSWSQNLMAEHNCTEPNIKIDNENIFLETFINHEISLNFNVTNCNYENILCFIEYPATESSILKVEPTKAIIQNLNKFKFKLYFKSLVVGNLMENLKYKYLLIKYIIHL